MTLLYAFFEHMLLLHIILFYQCFFAVRTYTKYQEMFDTWLSILGLVSFSLLYRLIEEFELEEDLLNPI